MDCSTSIEHEIIDDILTSKDYRQHNSVCIRKKKKFEKAVASVPRIKRVISPCINDVLSDAILCIEKNKKLEGMNTGILYENIKKALESKKIDYIPTSAVVEKLLFDESIKVRELIASDIATNISNISIPRTEDKRPEEINLKNIYDSVKKKLKSSKMPYTPTMDVVEMLLEKNLEVHIYGILHSNNELRKKIENILKSNDDNALSHYQKECIQYFHDMKTTFNDTHPRLNYQNPAPFHNALKSAINVLIVEYYRGFV
ncbi:Uncharacterised protein [uncultured archaeon]|nr:Uncharacterised protein [uncultured archaeon]